MWETMIFCLLKYFLYSLEEGSQSSGGLLSTTQSTRLVGRIWKYDLLENNCTCMYILNTQQLTRIWSRKLNVVLERTAQTIVGETLAKFDKNDKESRNRDMISDFTQRCPFLFCGSGMLFIVVDDFSCANGFLLFFKLFRHNAEEKKRLWERERMPEEKEKTEKTRIGNGKVFIWVNHYNWLVRSYKGSHPSGGNRHV